MSNSLWRVSAGTCHAKARDMEQANHVRFAAPARRALDFSHRRCTLSCSDTSPMGTACQTPGCKNETPPALAENRLCVLHFTLSLETSCAEMRRETALGKAPQERQREIMGFITEHGERLARVATSGLHLTDDLKARILSTFLTLMNLRENLDRSNMRSSFGRSGHAPR
jgi:hypothetical protein